MTFVHRPNIHGDPGYAANDNDARIPGTLSVLDLVYETDDDKIADLVRRTERLAIAIVVGMAICLIFVPAICVALTYGI